jgi:uncharacterized protein YjiS (DUF1127 family)
MPFAKSSPRHRSQIEPARQINRRPVPDLNVNCDRAFVIPLSRGRAPARPAAATMSALMVAAATSLSEFAANTLPNLLVAVFSWIIAETLAGCAAYAQAMYPIPEAAEPVPAEIPSRKASNHLSMVSIHARDDFGNREQPAFMPSRAAPGALAWPGKKRGTLSRWLAAFGIVVATCRSGIGRAHERRQAIAELRALDDRSLRDIGVVRYDIEYVVRHGARRE